MVQSGGVVEGAGYGAAEETEPFEVGDVVVGGAAEDVDAVDEEGDPAEEEDEEEGEFAATGEVVEVLAAEGGFEDEEVEVDLGGGGGGGVEGVAGGSWGS